MNNFKQKFTSYLHGRNFPSTLMTVIVVALVVFVNIIVYTLTSFFGLYIYKPEEADLSITDASDEVFESSIRKGLSVTVTFCMYEDDVRAHTTGRFVHETALKFKERYGDFINLRYVNVVTQLDSDGNYVDLSVYRDNGRGEDNMIYGSSVIFECGSNYRVVTDMYTSAGYSDFFTLDSEGSATSYNGEEVFSSMVRWVLHDDHGVAYFTIGHGETASLNLYNLLVCAGYYVEEINLRSSDFNEEDFLGDADLVVISNPISDFERGSGVRTEMERLASYAERGGAFLVTIDPLTKKLPVLNGFLMDYGMSLMTDADGATLIVKDSYNAITTDGFTVVTDYADNTVSRAIAANIASEDKNRVILKNIAPLRLSGNAIPLLLTSESSVAYSGDEIADSNGSYTVAACSEAENGSKLFFIPSVYLMANDATVTNSYTNKDFLLSLADEYFGVGDMAYGCRSVLYDDTTLEGLKMSRANLYTAIALAIPTLIAAVGAVVLIRRKNR